MARLLGPDRSRGTIIVLAKAPRPGFAKTRLSPPFTPEEASELYAHMLDDVLAATSGFARELALSAFVAIHPPAACPEIAVGAPASMHVIPQCGRDLPERMAWAVSEAAASGATRILLRGSDSPMLDQQSVAEAIERLDDSDLVLCPDLDGGYSLVGLRQPAPDLFEHPMSTQLRGAQKMHQSRQPERCCQRSHHEQLRRDERPRRLHYDRRVEALASSCVVPDELERWPVSRRLPETGVPRRGRFHEVR